MCRIWRQCECRKNTRTEELEVDEESEQQMKRMEEESGAGRRTRQAGERMDNELLHEMIYEYSKGDMQCLLGA